MDSYNMNKRMLMNAMIIIHQALEDVEMQKENYDYQDNLLEIVDKLDDRVYDLKDNLIHDVELI